MNFIGPCVVWLMERHMLNAHYRCDHPVSVLSIELANEIFESVGVNAISVDAKQCFIRDLQHITMRRLDGPPPEYYNEMKRREIGQLRKTLFGLVETLEKRSNHYPRPPALPLSWFQQLHDWLDDQEQSISNGPKRKSEIRFLTAELLEAFIQCFGIMPTPTLQGPASNFLKMYFRTVGKLVAQIMFVDKQGKQHENMNEALKKFRFPIDMTDEQTRSHILEFCKGRSSD